MNRNCKAVLTASILLSVPQLFGGENKTAFLSTCFSNVCIGDDVEKLIEKQPKWVTEHLKHEENDKYTVHLRQVAEVRKKYAGVIKTAYRDLRAENAAKLEEKFLDGKYSVEPTAYTRLMESLQKDRVPFIVADASVLEMLRNVPVCGTIPVHGVFVSESGLYTGVMLMPVNGKLAVVEMKRLFDLHVPEDSTEAQKSRFTFDQVAALVKQIDARYGTQWDASQSGSIAVANKAVGDAMVAHLTFDEVQRGYQKREVEPMMTLAHPDFDNFSWQKQKRVLDEILAASQACEVKTQVAIE